MPSKIYSVVEGGITFQDSGGDAVITLQNLAASSGGRVSARYDRGTGSKPSRARLWGIFQLETAGAVGETIAVWAVEWSSQATPVGGGAIGTADAAITADEARNFGAPDLLVQVDKAGVATDIIGYAEITVTGRYVSVAVRNLTADNLENTANANKVFLEWLPDESQ